jgi:PAS domain S-box-containing protein
MDGVDLELGLLDQAPVGLAITDRKGTVARWNRTASELFGWRAAEVLGRPISGLAAPDGDAEALHELIERTASGSACEGEVTLCDREGRKCCAALRMSPLRGRQAQVVGVVIVVLSTTSATASAQAAEVGARIAEARRHAGLTQQSFAAQLGVTRRSIQAYESGAVVPYKRLDQIGELLDRAPSWLLEGTSSGDAGPPPLGDLRAELRDALHEELIAVFTELGASSEQLQRAERTLIAGRRTP